MNKYMANNDGLVRHNIAREYNKNWWTDVYLADEVEEYKDACRIESEGLWNRIVTKDEEIARLEKLLSDAALEIPVRGDLVHRIRILKNEYSTEIARLRKALEFYGDEETWGNKTVQWAPGHLIIQRDIDIDNGKIAREALGPEDKSDTLLEGCKNELFRDSTS